MRHSKAAEIVDCERTGVSGDGTAMCLVTLRNHVTGQQYSLPRRMTRADYAFLERKEASVVSEACD